MTISFDCDCTHINLSEHEELMKNKKPFSYSKAIELIHRQQPTIYNDLALQFYNPFHEQTYKTKTHLIITHSAIEYFFYIVS